MKKKTSIYLPKRLVETWRCKQRLILAKLPVLLQSVERFTPTRARLRKHQKCPDGGVIVSVYWPLCTYNRLQSFVTATRISVSLLIAHLLESLQKTKPTGHGFLNYGFHVISWNHQVMAFTEELRFSAIPPPLTP
jgi:hypothetical protein